MRKRLLTVTLTVCACTGKILAVAQVPINVVRAIAEVEGGKNGGVVIEKNGQRSYGKYCISKAFLADTLKYMRKTSWPNLKISIEQIKWDEGYSRMVCQSGLERIMIKRNCNLRQAIAIYNGGTNGHKKKVCLAYADRVLALAKKKEKEQ